MLKPFVPRLWTTMKLAPLAVDHSCLRIKGDVRAAFSRQWQRQRKKEDNLIIFLSISTLCFFSLSCFSRRVSWIIRNFYSDYPPPRRPGAQRPVTARSQVSEIRSSESSGLNSLLLKLCINQSSSYVCYQELYTGRQGPRITGTNRRESRVSQLRDSKLYLSESADFNIPYLYLKERVPISVSNLDSSQSWMYQVFGN